MADKKKIDRKSTANSRRKTTSRSRSNVSYRDFQLLDRDEILNKKDRTGKSSSSSSRRRSYEKPVQGQKRQKKKKSVKIKKVSINPVNKIKNSFDLPTSATIDKSAISQATRVKRQNSSRLTNFCAAALFVIMIIYLAGFSYTFISNSSNDISNDTVKYGSVETPKSFTGVIIRDEEVYTAGAEGVVSYNVAENERVKANTAVCSVSDQEVVASMEAELEEINESILKLQESRQEISIYTEDVKKYNQQIQDIIDETSPSFVSNDISKLYTLKNNIQKRIDVRNQMLLSESNGSLSELASKRTEQESKLAENITNVCANSAGIVSYFSDGLENTFTFDNLTGLTKEQTLMNSEENLIKTNVTADTPVFKLVTSNQWYIAAYITNKYIDDWAAGEYHSIYVNDMYDNTTTINAYVESITTLDKESYVVLRADKYMLDFIEQRSITFETDKATEGYKIPNEAIVEQTLLKVPAKYVAENKIYKAADNEIKAIAVSVSTEATDTDNVYIPMEIGTINVGDVIVNPEDNTDTYTIQDVLTKKGIFIMNTGVAEFVAINTDNSVSNSTHTILDPSINPNITIYDKIVTDTANVEKQQRIYG